MAKKPVISQTEWDRITVKVPTVLKQKLAIRSIEERRGMDKIVIEMLKKYL